MLRYSCPKIKEYIKIVFYLAAEYRSARLGDAILIKGV